MENRLTGGGEVKGGGIEENGKKTHGHGQQCGDYWGKWGIRGLNGNGKNTIKIKSKNKLNKTEDERNKSQIRMWEVVGQGRGN